MLALKGVYENGNVTLSRRAPVNGRVDVVVTFLEEIEEPVAKNLNTHAFSFAKSREILRNFKGSLSEEVLMERDMRLFLDTSSLAERRTEYCCRIAGASTLST